MPTLAPDVPIRRHLCAAIALAVTACAESPAPTSWEVERVAVGDTTVVRTVAGQAWRGGVELVEDVTIGVLEGPPELTFGSISRIAEAPDGGVYVLDAQAIQIRQYDRNGEFVRDIGREGQGPGEYQRLSLGMVADAAGVLYMHDWGNRRVLRFGPDGEALPSWAPTSTYLTTVPGQWVFSEAAGAILVTGQVEGRPALLAMRDGLIEDTIVVPHLPGMPAERGGPYRVDTYWGRTPDGCMVVGVSAAYSLDVRCPDGVVRIEREVEPIPVHPEEAAAYRAQFEWMDREPQYRAPVGEWLPSTMPPFRGITVGRDARIWVRRNVEPIPVPTEDSPGAPPAVGWAQPFVYDVFEVDGTFLGEVRFPANHEPRLFGDGYVWAIRRGEFGEEYLVRLRVVPIG